MGMGDGGGGLRPRGGWGTAEPKGPSPFEAPESLCQECLSMSAPIMNIRQVARDLVNMIALNPHSSFMRFRDSY